METIFFCAFNEADGVVYSGKASSASVQKLVKESEQIAHFGKSFSGSCSSTAFVCYRSFLNTITVICFFTACNFLFRLAKQHVKKNSDARECVACVWYEHEQRLWYFSIFQKDIKSCADTRSQNIHTLEVERFSFFFQMRSHSELECLENN